MGHAFKTIYNEEDVNQLGQNILKTTTIDPRGIATIKTQDAFGRTVAEEVQNLQQAVISSQERFYDPQGNLTFQKDHVYKDDLLKNIQVTKYTYSFINHIESLTRAFGTETQEQQHIPTHLPEKFPPKLFRTRGALFYSYSSLGFLQTLTSSDGKISHVFEHDKLGHLILASDKIQKISIQRKVDVFGNVISEKFPNELEVEKSYDSFDRLLSLKISNAGEVLYCYDPLFLRQVVRNSASGQCLYTHTYDDYDLDGNLTSESLIASLGHIGHLTDPKGRTRALMSPYFTQECIYDSTDRLTCLITDGIGQRFTYDDLSQLIAENSSDSAFLYGFDSLHNRVHKNGAVFLMNDLNEILSTQHAYDLNGNQTLRKTPQETWHFAYDLLNRLTEATNEKNKISFIYDPLGRRLSKTTYSLTLTAGKKELTNTISTTDKMK